MKKHLKAWGKIAAMTVCVLFASPIILLLKYLDWVTDDSYSKRIDDIMEGME